MEKKFSTKILLDGADPKESEKTKELLGFLDGQTTNPTLLTKNPEIQAMIGAGNRFSEKDLYAFYEKIIKNISGIVSGPVSIEVYADKETRAEDMLFQAREISKWIANSCIKLPITKEGLKAANLCAKEDIPINMTLCFSQEQAAAVYSVTKGAKSLVFISPFVGRLDDRGENGMDLVKNIVRMYNQGDGHVKVLAASIRNLDHLLLALKLSFPAVTLPLKVLEQWKEKNFVLPAENFCYAPENLREIPYRDIDLNKNWQSYDIFHELTETGIEKFVSDWKSAIC